MAKSAHRVALFAAACTLTTIAFASIFGWAYARRKEQPQAYQLTGVAHCNASGVHFSSQALWRTSPLAPEAGLISSVPIEFAGRNALIVSNGTRFTGRVENISSTTVQIEHPFDGTCVVTIDSGVLETIAINRPNKLCSFQDAGNSNPYMCPSQKYSATCYKYPTTAAFVYAGDTVQQNYTCSDSQMCWYLTANLEKALYCERPGSGEQIRRLLSS